MEKLTHEFVNSERTSLPPSSPSTLVAHIPVRPSLPPSTDLTEGTHISVFVFVFVFFSRVLRDSTPRFVGPSVGPSVRRSIRHTLLFWLFGVFDLTAPAQMIW